MVVGIIGFIIKSNSNRICFTFKKKYRIQFLFKKDILYFGHKPEENKMLNKK